MGSRSKYTQQEDALILRLANYFISRGQKVNISFITQQLNNKFYNGQHKRTYKSVHNRFYRHLNPALIKLPFTDEEVSVLIHIENDSGGFNKCRLKDITERISAVNNYKRSSADVRNFITYHYQKRKAAYLSRNFVPPPPDQQTQQNLSPTHPPDQQNLVPTFPQSQLISDNSSQSNSNQTNDNQDILKLLDTIFKDTDVISEFDFSSFPF